MNIEEKYKDKIDSLWKEYENSNDTFQRGYAIEQKLPENSILFLGMNPSYDDKKDKSSKGFYPSGNDIKMHPYFNKFKEIAKENEVEFCHHDLFFVRETSQDKVEELRKSNKAFFDKQLEITKSIIKSIEPKMIVVCNAEATHMFWDEHLWGFETCKNWNEDLGYDTIPEFGNCPILFSGMLSGQRALDNGSFYRLKWHIRTICGSLKEKTTV